MDTSAISELAGLPSTSILIYVSIQHHVCTIGVFLKVERKGEQINETEEEEEEEGERGGGGAKKGFGWTREMCYDADVCCDIL